NRGLQSTSLLPKMLRSSFTLICTTANRTVLPPFAKHNGLPMYNHFCVSFHNILYKNST
ncbi:hypothetical protein L9F63_017727, partial [Diploptera punctata]